MTTETKNLFFIIIRSEVANGVNYNVQLTPLGQFILFPVWFPCWCAFFVVFFVCAVVLFITNSLLNLIDKN